MWLMLNVNGEQTHPHPIIFNCAAQWRAASRTGRIVNKRTFAVSLFVVGGCRGREKKEASW